MTAHASTLELSAPQATHRLNRRARVRHLCDRRASAQLGDGVKVGSAQAVGATVRNLSAAGVGLLLDCEFLPDTILLVEPAEGGGYLPPLVARVIHAEHRGERWYHGCELGHYLNAAELQDWLA